MKGLVSQPSRRSRPDAGIVRIGLRQYGAVGDSGCGRTPAARRRAEDIGRHGSKAQFSFGKFKYLPAAYSYLATNILMYTDSSI